MDGNPGDNLDGGHGVGLRRVLGGGLGGGQVADRTATVSVMTGLGDTKTRLCDAAERLVAAHGVEGPSTRAICTAAGANAAAVHYHFGSREALLDAVLERRLTAIGRRRSELVDALRDRDTVTCRDVAQALIGPTAEMARSAAGRHYVPFLLRLATAGPRHRKQVSDAFAPQLRHLAEQLARAMPSVPAAILEERLLLSGQLMLTALATPVPERGGGSSGTGDAARTLDVALVDYVAGALGAPHPAPADVVVRRGS